ncbi:MAG: T9SS type A sorting domain-containing protein [Muribaculaceae bacterium]|nr:T9SS type A sorting domain-containing protein [Muribaculaceae bacterium]
MKKFHLCLLGLLTSFSAWSAGSNATVTTSPSPAVSNKPLEVTIRTDNFGSEVYCYTWCADINGSSKSPWGWNDVNTDKFKMSGSNGEYTLTISNIKEFYGLSDDELAGLRKLGFIAKTSSGSQTADCFVTIEQGASSSYSGGEGTASSPYIIATAEDLSTLSQTADDWNASVWFRLDADIDASSVAGMTGTVANPFKGHFDGNGHTISNFTATADGIGTAAGLFAAIDGAEISDLGLVNARVSGSSYVGALAGYAKSGSVERCFSTGSVTGTSVCVGGLVGFNDGATVTDCYSTATVDNRDDYATGGLVGKNNGSIVNTYATGDVFGFDYAGGVTGANYGTVKNSVALNASINSASDYAARFGGNNNAENISTSNISWDNITAGHINWTAFGDHADMLDADHIADYDNFKAITGWDFDNVWEWRTDDGKSYPALRGISVQTCTLPETFYSSLDAIGVITSGDLTDIVTAGPNPTAGPLTVNSTAPLAALALYNLNGARMTVAECTGDYSFTLDLSAMPAGIYILNVTDINANLSTFKIIKK